MSILINEAIIKFSRGTAAAWTAEDTVLEVSEHGYETDTGKEKIGDGSTAWTALEYASETGLVEQVATNVTDIATNVTDITGKLTGVTDQLCKAWVNFDGTTNTAGKCTIADSYNVTDVDDDGTGLYTINFTNNLTLGYCAVGSGGNTGSIKAETIVQIGTLAVDSLIIATSNHAGDPRDRDIICVQIFGS